MFKRWRWVEPAPAELAERLSRRLRVHRIVAELLLRRGVEDESAAERFFEPKLTDLHDPALLPGAEAAGLRLRLAVEQRQPIVIYGDYDVDGVTASAILWHTLRAAGADAHVYIPHRLEEGYGLNIEAIEKIATGQLQDDAPPAFEGRPLVISVDCGITACAVAERARELGIDLIITDHHEFDPRNLPAAQVLVHPGLGDVGCGIGDVACRNWNDDGHTPSDMPDTTSTYPNPHLCGAGVAFKVAWQFAKAWCGSERVTGEFKTLLVDLLALVALGTVADVMPLAGENRTLTVFGLGRIKRTRFIGLNALIDAARLREEKVDAYHVGFVLGPRLNACGRMGHARDAAKLLTDATPQQAAELAEFLTGENDRRRATEKTIFEQARRMVVERGDDHQDRRAIVVAQEGWHAGVVGIVASRLVEAFGRPAIVLAIENGTAHGSARSVDRVSIHQAITACSGHLVKFGGHAMAAGLTLRTDAIDAFREQLIGAVNTMLSAEDLCGVIEIDGELAARDCTAEVFSQIKRLAPFGRGNHTPRLLLSGMKLERPAQRMGGMGKHLQLHLREAGEPEGPVLRAVAWNLGDLAEQLPAGVVIDAVFKPEINTWRGVSRPELHLEDLRMV